MLKKIVLSSLLLTVPVVSQAFCGFYVAKADSSLYNQASQVAMVRKDDKTVLSLMNDYQGELKDFALVVPVPELLTKAQIHIGDAKLFKRLDDFTAPRLVEYHDRNPCKEIPERLAMRSMAMADKSAFKHKKVAEQELGVTVEAEYTVGEYDIVILSAQQSDGLETWLHQNGYHIPKGASAALKPYIQQDMKFFVAKVNLATQSATGLKFLRPLQFAFQSEKFMLPIRLGMLNAKGPQDLLLYVLTENGRVESSNYRTVKLPSNMDLPVYLKQDFAAFYTALFDKQVEKHAMRSVFTEYFWNMGWCDPCAASPLKPKELKQLGVFWLKQPVRGGGVPVQVTRLHIRYTPETFPEDLMLQEIADNKNYQGRYILRHAWPGSPEQCPAAKEYFEQLVQRQVKEAQTLSALTGWSLSDIHAKMNLKPIIDTPKEQWWQGLW